MIIFCNLAILLLSSHLIAEEWYLCLWPLESLLACSVLWQDVATCLYSRDPSPTVFVVVVVFLAVNRSYGVLNAVSRLESSSSLMC